MNKRQVGRRYEQEAAAYLVSHGYEIIESNYYDRYGEVDLIARDGDYLVFIEVKFRASLAKGHPAEAVGYEKQKRLRSTAGYYLYTHRYGQEYPCRFDVVSILGGEITLIQNAF